MIQQRLQIQISSVLIGTDAGFQRKQAPLQERRYDTSGAVVPAAAA